MNPDAIDPNHAANRARLTTLSRRLWRGGLVALTTGIVMAFGGTAGAPFLGSPEWVMVAVTFGILGMWVAVGGLIAAAAGGFVRIFAASGSVARYQAAEVAPVVTDTAHAVVDDLAGKR